ncbi:MAG: hypothetical protein C4317_01640 [Acidimicrobiia bacterium]
MIRLVAEPAMEANSPVIRALFKSSVRAVELWMKLSAREENLRPASLDGSSTRVGFEQAEKKEQTNNKIAIHPR